MEGATRRRAARRACVPVVAERGQARLPPRRSCSRCSTCPRREARSPRSRGAVVVVVVAKTCGGRSRYRDRRDERDERAGRYRHRRGARARVFIEGDSTALNSSLLRVIFFEKRAVWRWGGLRKRKNRSRHVNSQPNPPLRAGSRRPRPTCGSLHLRRLSATSRTAKPTTREPLSTFARTSGVSSSALTSCSWRRSPPLVARSLSTPFLAVAFWIMTPANEATTITPMHVSVCHFDKSSPTPFDTRLSSQRSPWVIRSFRRGTTRTSPWRKPPMTE